MQTDNMPSENQQSVLYVMSRTRGLAWAVIQPHLTGSLETDFGSVDEVLDLLKKRFGGHDGMAKQLAEPMYHRLKQGKEERFETFYERWLACAALLKDYHEQHLVEDFLKKLSKRFSRQSMGSNYSDVGALAHWCRPLQIDFDQQEVEKLGSSYDFSDDEDEDGQESDEEGDELWLTY